jgi:hypothetical protein
MTALTVFCCIKKAKSSCKSKKSCRNFIFTVVKTGYAKPSPVGEGGSHRLTDEVLFRTLEITKAQAQMI